MFEPGRAHIDLPVGTTVRLGQQIGQVSLHNPGSVILSKRQRLQGDELLFSQSELAELDAELAPQPEDIAPPSERSPVRDGFGR